MGLGTTELLLIAGVIIAIFVVAQIVKGYRSVSKEDRPARGPNYVRTISEDTKLERACPKCGFVSKAFFKNCPHCGASNG
jgi:lipopolysaccharide biosynthesis regulator YciM